MITPQGVIYIKQFMSGTKGSLAEAISFGISGEDSVYPMGFELDYSNIKIISYDFVDDVIILKASLAAEIEAVIYEIGLVSDLNDKNTSKVLTTFDSTSEGWLNGVWQDGFTRIGADSLRLIPLTSATVLATLDDVFVDLSDNSGSDQFILAFNSLNGHTANVKFIFYTDSSNYYTITSTNPPVGYNFYRVNKNLAVSTGSPDWSNINMFGASATASGAGPAQVDFDGLRIQNAVNLDPEYTLVARKVLDTPYIKVPGRSDDIEYRLAVSVAG